ncbi:MAG TPA: hypothetical protein VJ966_00670 [Actinomycetes bacterium]|nr:hypothetical protein [Actinomycetes bacterium]
MHLLAQATDPTQLLGDPLFWANFGILGAVFVMLITRKGILTTKAHDEVREADRERIEELRADRDEWKSAYFSERDAREHESDARGLAEVRADAAVEAARTVANALDALRAELGRRR